MKTTSSESKELWQTTYHWLTTTGNSLNKNYCKEQLATHPEYPAISALADFLDSGNMEYQAVQADVSYIKEFNYPLLAHIRNPGQEYLQIIPDVSAWDKLEEIKNLWSGVVIYPEKNTSWHNKENEAWQKKINNNKLVAVAWLLAGLTLLLWATSSAGSFSIGIFGFLSLTGLVTSIFVLTAELGIQNDFIKQVCGVASTGGCDSVLKSSYGKGIAGVTPADASVLYFTTQFILVLAGSFYPGLFSSLIFISLATIIVAGWSIYTQAFKLKKWCPLCLAIVTVILLQAIVSLTIMNNSSINMLTFVTFPAIFIICTLGLLPVKYLLKSNENNRLKLNELKKWKTDTRLFITQWQEEQEVDITAWQHELILGKEDAPVLITVACNPYCGPCAKEHILLDSLLNRSSNKVKVQIRFLFNPNDETDKRTIAVKAILQQAAAINNQNEIRQMLSDWFAWMNYERWSAKWQPASSENAVQSSSHSNSIENVNQVLQKHFRWIQKNNIMFTPTFFINGKKMPGRYELNDIEKLVPQLADAFAKQPTYSKN